jgi:nucleotide-binding universal stress UspA family protein
VVKPGAPFTGVADPVSVREVATSTPSRPPKSMSEALSRFAKTDGAQVRVERYSMPDGTTRFVTYVKGTQSALYGGKEPWDMKSNAEMYSGQNSASYQATLNALEAAGAKPGDHVDIVAHSQAGLIAAELAMNSEFEVGTQITAGSPVEPTLDDDQTIVQLRHSDDIVSSLAQGGSPGGTGSPDSFTATKVGDPVPGIQDLWLDTHALESYIETAKEVEASGDPRVDAVSDLWDELAQAEEIVATEYHAERIDPLPAQCPPEQQGGENRPDAGGAPGGQGDRDARPPGA